MRRRGSHLFSLPSALKKRSSNSTLNSSNDSAISLSPEAPTISLPSSSRSSLADSSSLGDYTSIYHHWSLLDIRRVHDSPGMILISLYHFSSATLYTWPLQTNANAPQPKQGLVFITSLNEDTNNKTQMTSESLKILTGVVSTYMRQRGQTKPKVKLGEREEDTEALGRILDMPKIDESQRLAILDRQVVRPTNEWDGGKDRILPSLNISVSAKSNSTELAPPRLPSIEITSPTSSELLAKQNVPWLQERKSSYVS